MEPRGIDVFVSRPWSAIKHDVVAIIATIWPDAIIQSYRGDCEKLNTGTDLSSYTTTESTFFIYKDRPALDSWDLNGWSEDHGSGMLLVSVDIDGVIFVGEELEILGRLRQLDTV